MEIGQLSGPYSRRKPYQFECRLPIVDTSGRCTYSMWWCLAMSGAFEWMNRIGELSTFTMASIPTLFSEWLDASRMIEILSVIGAFESMTRIRWLSISRFDVFGMAGRELWNGDRDCVGTMNGRLVRWRPGAKVMQCILLAGAFGRRAFL